MAERFLGVTIAACTMQANVDYHWVSDCGDECPLSEIKSQGAGDYPLEDRVPDDRIQQEIDALHVYVARSMRALDDVLTSLVKMCPTPVVEQSIEQGESGLSNYQPRVDGSDELLNLSHVRIDAFRLAKQAQRLAYLYSKIGVPDESA